MIQRILGLILLTPGALTQIDAVRPDTSFMGNNDRFDLSGMVGAQNKMFHDDDDDVDAILVGDDEYEGVASDTEYRRQLHNENAGIFLDALNRKHPVHAFLTRRDDDKFLDDDKFAEDDRMNSFEGGTVSDFEDNLKHFQQANIKPPSRRKLHDDELVEHEILLQNVVPIVMKIDGYLKSPLQ